MRISMLGLALLAGCGQAPAPVADAIPPPPPGYAPVEAIPPPPPGYKRVPAKDEYIAAQDEGIVLAAGAAERMNAQAEADYQRRSAERRADERTDRIVDAQRDTQRELKRVADKLD